MKEATLSNEEIWRESFEANDAELKNLLYEKTENILWGIKGKSTYANIDDIDGVLMEAWMTAYIKYNPTKGMKFSTFLYGMAVQGIQREGRINNSKRSGKSAISSPLSSFVTKDVDDDKDDLKLNFVEKVEEKGFLSLEDEEVSQSFHLNLEKLKTTCPKSYTCIIEQYYNNKTQVVIGKEQNVSQYAISNRVRKGISIIRQHMRKEFPYAIR